MVKHYRSHVQKQADTQFLLNLCLNNCPQFNGFLNSKFFVPRDRKVRSVQPSQRVLWSGYSHILSVSQVANKALSSNVTSTRRFWDCGISSTNLYIGNIITLYCIPNQFDVDGNERVNELQEKHFTGPEPFYGLPVSVIMTMLRKP